MCHDQIQFGIDGIQLRQGFLGSMHLCDISTPPLAILEFGHNLID
jgi:hypothetical protein